MQNTNNFNTSQHACRTRERLVIWLTALLSVATLFVAGALGAAVRTGGTGQHYAFGEIEDFGSIVVHGVHYDESRANIIVDGVPNQSRAALKLGMVVEIEGDFNYTLGTGTAAIVRTNRAILGQVQSINSANGEMQVLSQRVAADVSTRFDGIANLSQIAAGDWVAIHGLNDPARNLFAATLIEAIAPPMSALSEIRGVVRNTRDDRFRIGVLDVISKTARVENGDFVAVKGYSTPSQRQFWRRKFQSHQRSKSTRTRAMTLRGLSLTSVRQETSPLPVSPSMQARQVIPAAPPTT